MHVPTRTRAAGLAITLMTALLAGCASGVPAAAEPGRPSSPSAAAEPPAQLRAPAGRGAELPSRPGAPPAPDADGDGIDDRCDACPRDPGTRWPGYPGIDGCPSAVLHTTTLAPEGASSEELAAHARRKERMQREAVCAR